MLIDVSMPITSGSVFRRGSPSVEIETKTFYHEAEGEYDTVVLSMPAHTATHIDLVDPRRVVSPSRMIGPGRLIDVSGGPGKQPPDIIELESITGIEYLRWGEFVFFRTGWSKYAGTEQYFNHPQLSRELVEWLAETQINAVGIDALGLGRDSLHGEFDRLLTSRNIFVIENLINLESVPAGGFTVYCMPLNIEEIDAIPARVLVEK